MDADLAGQLFIVRDIAAAMLFGGIVGFERERAMRPAGLRTHTLVAGAAALFVGLGTGLIASVHGDALRADPVRIIEAVVTGISFLGAGTIFRQNGHDHVEGLTTAASLLCVGGLGIAAATHRWVVAIGATVLVLIVLRGLGRIERHRRPDAGAVAPQTHEGPPATPR